MSQNTEKKSTTPEWPDQAAPEAAEPRPRRKRRVPVEPEDFWGRLRFRVGKKSRWFGRRLRNGGTSSSDGALLKYDFKAIAGVEPLALYNSGQGLKLHFWTRTKGYATCYRGSGGLKPQLRTVPYVMNTDDKAMIDRLKESLEP